MASEYILRPRPGYALHEAVESPTWESAYIEERRYGHLEGLHPVTPFTLSAFRPVPPPEYYRRERVGDVVLEKVIPEGYFASGASPFLQAVVSVVSRARAAEFPEIYRGVVDGFRIAPDSKRTQRMLRELVRWASGRPSVLTVYREGRRRFYRPGVPLKLRPPLVRRAEGVDPVDWAACDFGESAGTFSYPQLRDYVVETLGWLTSDAYLRARVDLLVRHGYLERVGELLLLRRRVDRFL